MVTVRQKGKMLLSGLITSPVRVPVLLLASVAVRLTVWAVVSLAGIVNVPFERVFLLSLASPKTPLLLLSNWTLPLLVRVTCVELSLVTVLLKLSLAVTVTANAAPAVCGEDAL